MTWDGLPVAREPPFCGVRRRVAERTGGREYLVLHRLAPGGVGYEGDWAWTPPAGARQPGEEPDAAALRELREETCLELEPAPVRSAPVTDVALYVAEAARADTVVLDAEHDRFLWLPLADAMTRCRPSVVAAGLEDAAAWLERCRRLRASEC